MNENENGIYNEDCIEGAKKYIADESVNLIICDPPFGIKESTFGSQYARDSGNILAGYKEAPADYYLFSLEWMTEAKRILKDNGSFYIVTGHSNVHHIRYAADKLGLHLVNEIIWKYAFGVNASRKFVSSHYTILYFIKNKKARWTYNLFSRFGRSEKTENNRSLLYADQEDVWVINKENHRGIVKNSNKLPQELIRKIVQYSSSEGDLVCDFFLGNFTTAFVSKGMRRRFSGFEINPKAYEQFIDTYNCSVEGVLLSDEDIWLRNWHKLQDELFG